jgi:3-oxoacyl-[acyl-carrier-protein] synthase-1
MMPDVFVSGMGIVSCLGLNQDENLKALAAEQSGLSLHPNFKSRLAQIYPLGLVKLNEEELLQKISSKTSIHYSRPALLSVHAVSEAIQQAQLYEKDLKELNFINATTVGGMHEVENCYEELLLQNNGRYNALADSLDAADCTQALAAHYNLHGLITTISTACSSSANAISFAARLIENGFCDKVLCGGTDALTRFTFNGFNALKNLDKNICAPFDQHRNGLNLGEGAAYLVLESETSVKKRNIKPLAKLSAWSNYNEAFHPTAPSPEGFGAYLAMKFALDKGGIRPDEINYVNAHGTATIGNDVSEGNAIKKLFPDCGELFSSTKAFTGHTLAAAGAMEAVFSILSIHNGIAYANLNFKTPMEETGISPFSKTTYKNIKHALSNSFGFGGNNASLLFSAC